MPTIQTFARPKRRRISVQIPREYDGYAFEVILVPIKPKHPKIGIADGKFRLPSLAEDRMMDREIEAEGAAFVRHGGDHDWYRYVVTGICEAVPRPREVNELLARKMSR